MRQCGQRITSGHPDGLTEGQGAAPATRPFEPEWDLRMLFVLVFWH
jgi:hypothetical protein